VTFVNEIAMQMRSTAVVILNLNSQPGKIQRTPEKSNGRRKNRTDAGKIERTTV